MYNSNVNNTTGTNSYNIVSKLKMSLYCSNWYRKEVVSKTETMQTMVIVISMKVFDVEA